MQRSSKKALTHVAGISRYELSVIVRSDRRYSDAIIYQNTTLRAGLEKQVDIDSGFSNALVGLIRDRNDMELSVSQNLKYITSHQVPEISALSHAVVSGNFVFVSGQVGLQSGNISPPEHFSDEVHNVFSALRAVLVAAGTTLDRVVKVNCYLSDIGYRAELNEIYMSIFTGPRPARTTVQVGLAHELRIEVDAIAAI